MSVATPDRKETSHTSLLSDQLYRTPQPGSEEAAAQWITMDEPRRWHILFGLHGRFEFEEKPAEWLMPLVTRICELGFLPENWDSYGARPISPQNAASALEILMDVLTRDTPTPSIVPTCRGGLQAEWHVAGIDLEIEFHSPHQTSLSFEDGEQDEELEDVDIPTIREKLQELRRRVAGG